MKKIILMLAISLTFSSCYVHKAVVGEGSQKGLIEKETQHNFIYGLASGKTPDTQSMAKGEQDYDVQTSISFVDGLLNLLTGGIYTPSTVEVKR